MQLRWAPLLIDGEYASWVDDLEGQSGAYLIRSRATGEIWYVGESHSGRLRKTLLRHFQNWTGEHAGTTYNAPSVEVAIVITRDPSDAPFLQYDLIQELDPRDNQVTGESVTEEEVPF